VNVAVQFDGWNISHVMASYRVQIRVKGHWVDVKPALRPSSIHATGALVAL